MFLKADRVAVTKLMQEEALDPNHWFNKFKTISEEEMDLLPDTFMRKYTAMGRTILEHRDFTHMTESKNKNNWWNQVKDLEELQTNEQKQEDEDFMELRTNQRENELGDFDWTGYMTRQPRYNHRAKNFNFEDFYRFTQTYEQARELDEENSKQFYKLVKYVKNQLANSEDPRIAQRNLVVRDFLKKYRIDLIEIPEEFQDLEVEEDFNPKRRSRTQRKRVYTRSDRSLKDYDVWRCHDRQLLVAEAGQKAVCKITVAPSLLKRAFGQPDESDLGFKCTGYYDFEDTFLDLFRLMEYKQTDYTHGLAREPEYYETKKNMKKPYHKRKRPYPTVDEFWNSDEPVAFRLLASHHADWRRFRRWIRSHFVEVEADADYDYDKQALEKFGKEIEICIADYDTKGVVNTEMAAFKWTNLQYMDAKEIKKLPQEDKLS
eukprot:CAMPEP_0170495566 /NCGR_PEP_ID=MMETSP0208-20121228/17279_1 /TAXON_ID=197538 /ORGANISM="Strombidium inclinatum, Strain S3" /LENGTH=431 /DNA_ID=CAMNT_0010771849 /DNA_START=98 /DNA_END=1389 /DNA_ORIENTATION=-